VELATVNAVIAKINYTSIVNLTVMNRRERIVKMMQCPKCKKEIKEIRLEDYLNSSGTQGTEPLYKLKKTSFKEVKYVRTTP